MSWGPVDIQVLVGALRSACEEMGAALIRSAYSANIKERRDCSTALFDRSGELVMQAEHIPVHLGSMPEAVEAVLGLEQAPDRTWILNDPFRGGTHLPDVTLITPVFADEEPIGFAASRAHHADVGGETPGSMPAHSTELGEEGLVIPPSELTAELVDDLVSQMRGPEQRRADLRAQLAANRTGVARLGELAAEHGPQRLREGLAAILEYSERRARAALEAIPDGTATATDRMELAGATTADPGTLFRDEPECGPGAPSDGADGLLTLRCMAALSGGDLILDFSGTDDQVAGNLNCPLAVTRSAALFAVRALTDPDAPPSAGAHRPVRILVPPGCVLAAKPPAAVAGGNVETSSRVADLVLEALGQLAGAPAQGQGTMNNLVLASAGGEQWTFYETLGGGQGAGPDAPGPDAIHVAMSNTLNTPVEALETEYPLRVRELSIRRGSGGAGARHGGDGLVREIETLAPARFSLVAERRRIAPRGRDGGEPGTPGRDTLNGAPIPAKSEGALSPGDVLRIETPGGGGYGNPGAGDSAVSGAAAAARPDRRAEEPET